MGASSAGTSPMQSALGANSGGPNSGGGGMGTGGGGWVTSFLVGVEMDFFGIPLPSALAGPQENDHYKTQTVTYLKDFYYKESR